MDFLLRRQILCKDHEDCCPEKLSRAFAGAALMHGKLITSIAMQIEDNKIATPRAPALCEQSLTVMTRDLERMHLALHAAGDRDRDKMLCAPLRRALDQNVTRASHVRRKPAA